MKNEDMEKLARAAAYQDGQIAEKDTRIAELKERLWVYDNALKMALDEKCSGDQEHCGCVPVLKGRLAELQSRLHLIIDLGFDYDGFETVENLKSLIDDMVKVARGEDAELSPIDHAKVAEEIYDELTIAGGPWEIDKIAAILAKHYGKKEADDANLKIRQLPEGSE